MTKKSPRQTFTLPTHSLKPSHKVAYVNARLFDPESGLDAKGSLLTSGNIIADMGKRLFNDGVPDGIEVVDCGGHLLTPGLLDIQVHFREPGQEYKETIHTGSKSSAAAALPPSSACPTRVRSSTKCRWWNSSIAARTNRVM